MRLRIQSGDREPVRLVLKRAGRMADQVERLRYLRSTVTIGPEKPGTRLWRGAMWIVGAVLGVVGVVLALWRNS